MDSNDVRHRRSQLDLKYAKEDYLMQGDSLCSNSDSDDDGVDNDNAAVKAKVMEVGNTGVSQLPNRAEPRSLIPECASPHSVPGPRTVQAYSNATRKEKAEKVVTHRNWLCRTGIKLLVPLLCVVCAVYYSQKDTDTLLKHEELLRRNINNIRYEFPSQPKDTWIRLSAGIKGAQEDPTNPKPAVFLLLHEMEEETPVCLARKIGKVTTPFLNATNPQPLVLEGVDFEHNDTLIEDYGILVEEYRSRVEEQRAVIVNNLHRIPGKVAQCFHSFCDSSMPVVKKAVYFFTMKASGVNHAMDNPTRLAEKELKKLWGGQVDEDILEPLIVRITDTTMVIIPEKNLASCY